MSADFATLMFLEGGNALSGFRARRLLSALQALDPRVQGVSARYVHWVRCRSALDEAGAHRLEALLRYGEPAAASDGGALVVVMPRLGTVSPWASKATDIAHNCGA